MTARQRIEPQPKNGGKRPGAGRPEAKKTVLVAIRVSPEQAITLRKMSVARWLRPLLDSLPETIQADWIDGLPKPVTNSPAKTFTQSD